MSAPAEPQSGKPAPANKPVQHRSRHQPHEKYRRTSAVIDDRPDGQPVIFGYGRHMSKREKDRARRMIAYTALELVVAVCLVVVVVFAAYETFIKPNNTIATVTSNGVTGRINRGDVDALNKYYTYVQAQQAQNGQTSVSGLDPRVQAIEQLQQSTLAADEAKLQFGITATSADIEAAYKKSVTGSGQEDALKSGLSAAGMSLSDYKRLLVAPNVINQKLGEHLTAKDPKTAEQWHYARIEATGKITATSLLATIGKNNNPAKEFATLAKSKSTDTQTSAKGGDIGWMRASDTALDTLLSPELISTLKAMQKSHTTFKLYNTGSSWYVLEFLGHDLKHKLSSDQTQLDQTAAVNKWGNPLVSKALFNPPLPTSGTGLTTGQ